MLLTLDTLELVDFRPLRPEDLRRALRGVTGAGERLCRLYCELDTLGGIVFSAGGPPVIELAMGRAGFGAPFAGTRGLALPAVYFPVAGRGLSPTSFPLFFPRSGVD